MKRCMSLGSTLLWAAGMACADEAVPLPACAPVRPCDYEFNCSSAPCERAKPQAAKSPTIIPTAAPAYSVDTSADAGAKWQKDYRAANRYPFQDPGVVDTLRYGVDDRLSLTGRLGGGFQRARTDFGGGGRQTKGELGTILGVGVSYKLNDRWTLNADVDVLPAYKRIKGPSITTIGVSLDYRF